MSARQPRFEIVRTDAGWHARFIAANGRVVWTTEVYRHRGGAIKAINVLGGIVGAPQHVRKFHEAGVRDVGYGVEIEWHADLLEVRDIDEREVSA